MFDINEIIPEGFCLKCDGCCRFTSDDSAWFGRLLKEEEKKISKDRFRPIPNKKDNNFLCAFLRIDDNKCKIYKTRPFECRLYPFLLARDAKTGKIFLALDRNCPFAGQNLKNAEFKKYTEYLSALFKTPDFAKLIKSNPQVIQSYQGVLNLAELTNETK